MLPFRSKLIHARWSGEACWVPMGERRFDIDMRLTEEDFVHTRDWLDDALGLQAMLKSEAQTTGAKRSKA